MKALRSNIIILVLLALATPASSDVIQVQVVDSDFSPDPTISQSDTVRWVWNAAFPHSTTSVAGISEAWESGVQSTPFTFDHTFTNIGTFPYYCTVHGLDNGNMTASGMSGVITVEALPFPTLHLDNVTSGELISPVGFANAGDDSNRLFLIEQRGQIRILQNDALLATPFLDIESKLVNQRPGFDERGLLGLAFHPQYADNETWGEGKFYVYYSAPSLDNGTAQDPDNHTSVVAEYQVSAGDPNIADNTSERILLTFKQPQWNHDGGQLAFGSDGKLYISTGDGGSGGDNEPGHTGGGLGNPSGGLGNAQDRTRLLGKVLRIDVAATTGPGGQYGIPVDNPFFGIGGGVKEEIYAYGLRNPWRFSFDDGPGGTDKLFLADVGQGDVEEVDIIVSGGNYGWRIREGSLDFDNTTLPSPVVPLIDPIAEYSRQGKPNALLKIGFATVGGYVYRGSAIPNLVGKYVFADWSNDFTSPGNGTLLGLVETPAGTWDLSVLALTSPNPIGLFITAIGEDESGELYVAAKSALDPGLDPNSNLPGGVIFKIVP